MGKSKNKVVHPAMGKGKNNVVFYSQGHIGTIAQLCHLLSQSQCGMKACDLMPTANQLGH